MLQKFILILLGTAISIGAYGMEQSSQAYLEKLGNPWATAYQNAATEEDPAMMKLLQAIAEQDVESVRHMVTNQPTLLESRNIHGLTPLHFAANFESVDVVQALLACGASVHNDSPVGTPLHMAASEGLVPVIELLLVHGANIHARDQWGRTPLFDAIYDLNYDAVALLLKKGAAIEKEDVMNSFQDNMGRSPLHTAVIRLNEITDFRKKCQENPEATLLNPDKYLIRYLSLQREKKCIAKLLFTHLKSVAEIKDRLDKTAYDYERLVKVLPLTEAKKEKVSSSFLPAQLVVRKSPPKRSPKKSPTPQKKSLRKPQPIAVPVHAEQSIPEQKTQEPVPVLDAGEVLEEVKAQGMPLLVQLPAPVVRLYDGYTQDRFASRVLQWFGNTDVSALLAAGSGWWYTQSVRRKLNYHQIPFDIIDDVMQFGKEELRERAKASQGNDVRWRMHGCMLFDDGMHNPWCPGKSKQEGFYHCTQGRDGKIYHIGFDPIQGGAFLTSYFPEDFINETIKTKIYDPEKRVMHILYA